jgi:YesN/AraC family two-component response regulator
MFRVCGTAGNGIEALELIEARKPGDLLDMKMPVSNGLQIRGISQEHSSLRASEFEYARRAMEIGAKACMLKPVDAIAK